MNKETNIIYINRCFKYIMLAIMLTWCVLPTSAQDYNEQFDIYFRQDGYLLEEDVKDNKMVLERLMTVLREFTTDTLLSMDKVEINSFTSPEAGVSYNKKLSQRRSESIRNYIIDNWDYPDSLIIAQGNGIAWDKLRSIVAASDMDYRDEVLWIIDNVPVETWGRVHSTDRWMSLLDSREKHLMDLKGGVPYRFLYDSIYPELRYGSQILLYYKNMPPPIGFVEVVEKRDFPMIDIPVPLLTVREPMFAVKSNLLFDLATALNVEIEVPITNSFSIAAEWIFPWWVTSDNAYALEVLSGTLEFRHWLSDRPAENIFKSNRTRDQRLTGWFIGLYAGGGLYDLQWKNNGYQGEFYIASGFSLGYAHPINKSKSLRLEYSLGIGYLKTNYRYYEGMFDNKYLVWQYDGSYTWFGPTRAKVSLSWMLYRTKSRKGVCR